MGIFSSCIRSTGRVVWIPSAPDRGNMIQSTNESPFTARTIPATSETTYRVVKLSSPSTGNAMHLFGKCSRCTQGPQPQASCNRLLPLLLLACDTAEHRVPLFMDGL